MRIAAIVNPFAGRHAAGKQWPVLVRSAGGVGDRIETFRSEYPGHSESIAAAVRRAGYDRVVAVGGDGTLFEVLNGLWREERGRMPSVGMVPFGTGCDYIRNFQVRPGTAERFRAAIAEPAVRVSLGKCRYRARGEMVQRVFAMVLGCWFGKGMKIAPGASPSHRRFEFLLAAPVSPAGLLPLIFRAYLGLRGGGPGIMQLYAKSARLRFATPVMLEADGELLGQTDAVEIDVIRDAFSFAAPGIRR